MSIQSDRDLAVNYLRFWYNASPWSALPPVGRPYPEVIQMLDRGIFLSNFGSAVKSIRQDKVKRALERLGKESGLKLPSSADFFSAVAEEVNSLNLPNAKEIAISAAQDTVKDVQKVAGIAIGGYALFLAVGALLILWPTIRRAL